MGPLSAVAICAWIFTVACTWLTWISASTHFLGVVGIIAVVVVLLDVFWIGSGARWAAYRSRPAPPA